MIRSQAVIALSMAIPALAAPAAAQFVSQPHYPPVARADPFLPDSRLPGPGIWREVDALHRRIDRARDAGQISRREARQARREADLIATHAQIYGRDGLSSSEQTELETRTRVVESAIPPPSPGRN